MNLLREYIRALLTEAAKTMEDLPEGAFVVILQKHGGSSVHVHIGDEKGTRWATPEGWGNRSDPITAGIEIAKLGPRDPEGPCGGAWMVEGSGASQGWGPLVYDVAIEYASLDGSGLMADRGSVSKDARGVWDYYMNNRSDVTAHQLDDLKDTLTPEWEDNCQQSVSLHNVKLADLDDKGDSLKWVDSPLSKRYTAPPKTINMLRAAGKLVEL
jgi:hypothetical protein